MLGAIDVQAHIASIRAQRLANGPQQATRVDGIVDDIKGGDHIILFGQACGHVALLEAHPAGDPRCLSIGSSLCDRRLEDVIADVARAWKGLRQLDQRLAASTADIGHQRAAFQPGLHLGHGWQPHRDEQVLKPTCGEAFQSVPHVVVVGRLGDASPVLEGLDQLVEGSDHAC